MRRELGKLPAWGQVFANGGQTCFVDVPPLRASPRVAWQVPAEVGGVVANAFVLARETSTGVEVLELEKGARRVTTKGHSPILTGDVLLVRDQNTCVAHDAWTGEELYRVAMDASLDLVVGSGHFITEASQEAWVDRFDDPRKPPEHGWDAINAWGARIANVIAFRQRIENRVGTVVLRLAGERLREHDEGFLGCLDDDGLVVMRVEPERLTEYDVATGAKRWSCTGRGVHALTPTFAFVRQYDSLIAVERRTQRVRTLVAACDPVLKLGVARDVIYSTNGPVAHALDLDGKILWETPRNGEARGIVPVHNGLLVLTETALTLLVGD